MSPISQYLHDLRLRRGLSQAELADTLGYEQSYISALELGIKGPPTDEFLSRLIQQLSIPSTEEIQLRAAADASQRKFVIAPDAPQDLYWLLNDLRAGLDSLCPVQVRMIREILCLRESLLEERITSMRRTKKRRKEDVHMGQT